MSISKSRSLKELIQPFSLNKPVNPAIGPTQIDQFIDRVMAFTELRIGEALYAVQWADHVRQLTLKSEPRDLEGISDEIKYKGEEQIGLRWNFQSDKWTLSHSISSESKHLEGEHPKHLPSENEARDLVARFQAIVINMRCTRAIPEHVITYPFGFYIMEDVLRWMKRITLAYDFDELDDLAYLRFPYEGGALRVDAISSENRVSVYENRQVPNQPISARDKWVLNFRKRPQAQEGLMTVQLLRSLDVTRSYPAARCSSQKGS